MSVSGNTEGITEKAKRGRHPNSLKNLRKSWAKGESGNLKGRPTDLISRTLRQMMVKNFPGTDKSYLELVLTGLIKSAAKGNPTAAKIIFEYTEGKLPQPITFPADEDGRPPTLKVEVEYLGGQAE